MTLAVRDVTVRVRARTLLEGVTFEVDPGQIVAIIGPNGAGKTTLLEVIAGMRDAEGGSVAFRGVSLRGFRERARHFAFLPDGGELPSELRVRGVIDHALRFRSRPPELVLELRKALGTDSLEDVPASVLSRGER
ncbi:MAG TPA: ABC transporter ATP-binding protein, partial [Polyangiaceae bacterium]